MTVFKAPGISKPILQGRDLHLYQVKAIKHALTHNESMIWCEVGLGKTIMALTTIMARMDRLQVYGTLVVATKAIIQTVWEQEARGWEHTKDLTFSLVDGKPDERTRGLRITADVYLIHYGNLPWLTDALEHMYLSRGKVLPFNFVVFDEVTKLKNSMASRHKAIRRVTPYIPHRLGLTGTPASNGIKDLHGQYLAVDSGVRLGVRQSDFEKKYFYPNPSKAYSILLKDGAGAAIKEAIVDITYKVEGDDVKSYAPFVENDVWLTLPTTVQKQYDTLEKDMFLQLDKDVTIEVSNKAVLTNKCLQAANGALYSEPGTPEWALLHDVKLDALEDVVEGSGDSPLLVLYAFKHDLARIQKRFPYAERLHGGLPRAEFTDLCDRFNRKEVKMLLGHGASIGHGINLQHGSNHVIWFGASWSLDLYEQSNGRLRRQGQEHPVILTRILMANTLDEAVVAALENKSATQDELKSTINSYRNKKAA